MTESINRDLATSLSAAVINDTLTSTGEISGGITVVSNVESLPAGSVGDRAFVTSTDGYYIHSGDGWFQIALINTTPVINSLVDANGDSATSPFVLSTEGATSVITVTATDPEGTPVIYSAVTDTGFDGMATVSQSGQDFTITPLSEQSATTESGTITFRASDSVNIATQLTTFTLEYVTATENSSKTTLLVKAFGNNGTNTIFSDGSTNSHTITAVGNTVAQAFSPYRAGGYSAYFDGTGDYLTVPGSTDFSFGTNPFTIEWWQYWDGDNGNGYGTLYSNNYSSAPGVAIQTDNNVNKYITYLNGTGTTITESTAASANQWYHYALVRNGNTFTFYRNGIAAGTATLSGSIGSSVTQAIGARTNGILPISASYIRDFRIVKGTAVYTTDFTPPTEPLTEITNTSLLACHLPYFADGSSNSHTITVNGDTKVEPFGPYDYEPYSASKHGASAYFDGSGDYLSIPDDSSLEFGSGDFTVEFWYKGSDTDQYVTLTTKGSVINGASTGNWVIIMNQYVTGDISVYVADYSLSSPILNTGAVGVSNDNWHHIAFVRNGTSFNLYVDGVSKAVTTSSLTFGNNASNVIIGKDLYYGRDLSGFISDYRIVKGTAVYTSNFTPPTAPLSAITNTSLLLQSSPNVYDASGSTRVVLSGVTSANLNTKYTSNIVLDGGAEKVFFYPVNGSYHNDVTGDFTVETWIQLESNTIPYAYLWSIRNSANTGGPRIQARFGDSGFGYHLQFELNGTGLAAVHSVNLTQSNFNTYKHVALTRSNGVVRCFVDGTQYSFGTGADPSSFPNSTISFSNSITNINEIIIGNAVDGQMEDFRFTNGLARYTSNFTPPTSELLG
jgi:hypothetical protein